MKKKRLSESRLLAQTADSQSHVLQTVITEAATENKPSYEEMLRKLNRVTDPVYLPSDGRDDV